MSSEQTSTSSEKTATTASSRARRPQSPLFKKLMMADWAPRPAPATDARPVAAYTAERRAALSAQFPGKRLVLPAGTLKQRNSDCDFRYRCHSAFAHLTGLGSDAEPDSVLVFEPTDNGHDATLFFRPLADRDNPEFYADPHYGELWVGPRPSLEDMQVQLGLSCRHVSELPEALAKNVADGGVEVLVIREADPSVTTQVDDARSQDAEAADAQLAQAVSELRMFKDAYEVDQMREAVAATIQGFENIARHLPEAVAHRRGERVVEAAFASVARMEGNGPGYDVIAASGNNACTLHWTSNDGPVAEGDVLLVDAGVEVDSLYTADLTRSIPVSGEYTPIQRKIYEAVLEAADASFAAAVPGQPFKGIHDASMRVIASKLIEWGLLDCTLEEALDEENGGHHRRWMIHGTSHHLGIDVHDCAQADREKYVGAKLAPGMVFTIEPGLYFKKDDLSVPEEFRGIGVRIEDNVLITESGAENLSKALPREADAVEAWVKGLREKSDG